MTDNVGKFIILNNEIHKSNNMDKLRIPTDNVVYEVIRLIDGMPLFLEDHYGRMKNSVTALGMDMKVTQQELRRHVTMLAEANGLANCNAKVIVYPMEDGQGLFAYVSRSYYPPREVVESGVKVSLLHLERTNPNIKRAKAEYRETVSKEIENKGVFEVLLVDRDGKITEGSKSNVFFVKGSRVFTAPGEYVLRGVTRQYVIDTCRKLGFEVILTLIGVDSLRDMDGVFLSGTSVKVLPVSQVGDMSFASAENPTITAIRDLFDKLIEEHIKSQK